MSKLDRMSISFVVVCCVCAGCPKQEHENSKSIVATICQPPAPRPEDPVDYNEWVNHILADGRPREWKQTYARFWLRQDDAKAMPLPEASLKNEIESLMHGPVWKPEEHPAVVAYLQQVKQHLALFQAEAEKPGYVLKVPPPTEDWELFGALPRLELSRWAVWSLLAQGYLEDEAQLENLFDAWQTGLRHADHLAMARSLIPCRLASTYRLHVYESMRNAVALGLVDAVGRRRIRELLDAHPAKEITLAVSMCCELAGSYAFLQGLQAGDEASDQLCKMMMSCDQVAASRLSTNELAAAIEGFYREVIDLANDEPSGQQVRQLRGLEPTGVPVGDEDPLLARLKFSFLMPFRIHLRSIASERALRLILTAHDYRDENGAWPAKLEDLSLPHAALLDPFDGTPFHYRVPEGDASFILYTVDEDGSDDGGNHAAWDNRWRPPSQGTDHVFWPTPKSAEAGD